MRSPRFVVVLGALAALVVATAAAEAPPSSGAAPTKNARTPAVKATEQVAVISTELGDIVWRFLPGAAPGHVAYVKELIARKFYDQTTFHRVIPHFVVQGGDPNSKDADRSNDGEGEGDRRVKAEFSKTLHYRAGTVGMARDADPDSGSCQFFIALTDLPRLDGRYTIFGEVISGMDVAERIAQVPRDLNDNPLAPVKVTVRLEEREVPPALKSRTQASASGEVLTGPSKPWPYDPHNVLWKVPTLTPAQAGAIIGSTAGTTTPSSPASRLELAVDRDGSVLDVRFPRLDTTDAAAVRSSAMTWRFAPPLYDGRPQKVRFEIDSNGKNVGPPTGGGAPVEIGTATIVPPRAAARVVLKKGVKLPAKPPKLRLTIDATGAVTNAALQQSCGDVALDKQAVEAAKSLRFAPATRSNAKGEPEPLAVYLDIDAVFDPGS